MKNLSSRMLLTSALVLGAFVSSAPVFAQQPKTLRVNVPFEFEDGSTSLPAGIYQVSMPSDHLMLFDNTNARAARYTTTIPDQATRTPYVSKVVFRRYGNRYFLHEVWIAGETTGHALIPTKAEKQLQIARIPDAPTGTEVALNVLPQ